MCIFFSILLIGIKILNIHDGYIAKEQPSILAAAAKMSTALLHSQILAANLFYKIMNCQFAELLLCQGKF